MYIVSDLAEFAESAEKYVFGHGLHGLHGLGIRAGLEGLAEKSRGRKEQD